MRRGTVAAAFLLLGLIIIIGYAFFRLSDNEQGWRLIPLLSDSMQPALRAGDLLLLQESSPSAVQVGDIVVYRSKAGELVAHRVVAIETEGGRCFLTKGDANGAPDEFVVAGEQLLGKVKLALPKGAVVMDFVKGNLAMVLLIIAAAYVFLLCGLIVSPRSSYYQGYRTRG